MTQTANRLILLLPLGSIVLSQASLSAVDLSAAWSEFQNGGRLVVGQTLPTEWSPTSELAWQVDLEGYGQSTPVVYGEQVFVTTTRGENKDVFLLAAYGLADGVKRWQMEFNNPTPEENSSYVSRAAPTPVVDSEQVIALFEGGVLAAATHDGQAIWQRNLVDDYGAIKARHGLASSLTSYQDQVIVWIERSEEPYLLSVERTTGVTKWKTTGLGATTWSTPRLISVAGRPQLVCSASGIVVGIDPDDGQRLWELDGLSGNTSPTPVPVGDGLFFLGATEGRGEATLPGTKNCNGLIKVSVDADGNYSAAYVWRAAKATCSFASPIVVGDFVYEVNAAGVLYGLDLKTGEQKIQQRAGVASIWATPIATDGQLYLFGRRGETSIIDLATHEIRKINQLWNIEGPAESSGEPPAASMGGHTLYAVAVASDMLLLRRGDKLFAVFNDP